MSELESIKTLYEGLPVFQPNVPVALLPYVAILLLTSTFGLAFYFSTLPKDTVPIRETVIASTASILGGFGIVALFCTVGVFV